MTLLDNYMFRPLLVIFRLSLRELKVLLYNVRARDGEIFTSGLRNSLLCSMRWRALHDGVWWLVSRLKLVWRGVFLFFLGVVLWGGPKWPWRHSPLPCTEIFSFFSSAITLRRCLIRTELAQSGVKYFGFVERKFKRFLAQLNFSSPRFNLIFYNFFFFGRHELWYSLPCSNSHLSSATRVVKKKSEDSLCLT